MIWYSAAPDQETRVLAARRYVLGVSGKGEGSDRDKEVIRSINPAFEWFVYNSCSDNYVPPRPSDEHNRLIDVARRRGVDLEALYLHYVDDTRITLGGKVVFVPGWGGGSAADPADARIPVYYPDLTRRLTCFADPQGARVHREVMLSMAFDEPFDGTSLYPDGIFLDNAAARIFNTGELISGGHVREVPGRPTIKSSAFRTWYWETNLGPFLTALKDTLESSASWSPDGRRKRLMINVSSVWEDDYVRRDVADILALEFQYNPIRSAGLDAVDEAYRRDALAAAAGITTFYSPVTSMRCVKDRPYCVSYGEILLANLAWYLTTRTERSILFQMGANAPSAAGWDTLTWRGCMDIVDQQLGDAIGRPFTLAKGTDPTGNRYVIKAREYERGLTLVRPRGGWREGIEPETAVWVELPQPLCPVDPSGKIGSAVTRLSLRSGQGAVLLGDPGRPRAE